MATLPSDTCKMDAQEMDLDVQATEQADTQQTDSQPTASQQSDFDQQEAGQGVVAPKPDEILPESPVDGALPTWKRQGNQYGHNDTSSRDVPVDQSTIPPEESTISGDQEASHAITANTSSGMLGSIAGFFPLGGRRSVKRNYEQHEQERQNKIDPTTEERELNKLKGANEQISVSKKYIFDLEQKHKEAIESKERKWKAIEREWEVKERKWKASEREWQAKERAWNTSQKEWEATEWDWNKRERETNAREREWTTSQREWKARHKVDQTYIVQLTRDLEEKTRIFQARLQESNSEKLSVQNEHNAFIRKQQEASFKQMESARWLPMDEGRVMSELDKLKRDLRGWARSAADKDTSLFQSLGEEDFAGLKQDLVKVAKIEDNQLPEGLSTTSRSLMLLLNALLAHSIYTSFFRSPFFFLGNGEADDSSNAKPQDTPEDEMDIQKDMPEQGNAPPHFMPQGILENIYRRAQEANPSDAHTWRSQTLRLLMPPLRNDSSAAEKELRRKTEDTISHIAEQQALSFLDGPASHLVGKSPNVDKLKKIYIDAAKLAYMLWTRRTEMRCFTLQDVEGLAFDPESEYFDPDSLVRYDDHEDQLKGKSVTVMVHPLLKVYGTDEAKDYDKERVWARGVVWLNSKDV